MVREALYAFPGRPGTGAAGWVRNRLLRPGTATPRGVTVIAKAGKTLDKLATVNGLRAFAILAVMYHHTGAWPSEGPFLPWTTLSIGPILHNGWTGVNLFFILSGFVLFLPYAKGTRNLATFGDATTFYRRRFWRLMPAYYVAALVLLVVTYFADHPVSFGRESLSLLTFSFVFSRYSFGPGYNPALWSLGVEVLFSLAFPLLIIAVRRFGIWRLLWVVLVTTLIARAVGRLWSPQFECPHAISDNITGRLDEFVLGMVVAHLYVRDLIGVRARHLLLPGIALILAAWFGYDGCRTRSWQVVLTAPLNNVLDAGLCAVLLAALSGRGVAVRFLSFVPLQVVGMMCYSLYLWQMPIGHWLAEDPSDSLTGLRLVWYVVLTFVVAALSYRFIEFGHVRDWRSLFLIPARRRRAQAPNPALDEAVPTAALSSPQIVSAGTPDR